MYKNDAGHRQLRAWGSWYSANLAGNGIGIGEGNPGVTCARQTACLGAQEAGVETVLGAAPHEILSAEAVERFDGSPGVKPSFYDGESRPGYFVHEMEGIGGVVKKKLTNYIRVAKVVQEFEDERDRSKLLQREIKGETRSWCGWCDRVILGHADMDLVDLMDPLSISAS